MNADNLVTLFQLKDSFAKIAKEGMENEKVVSDLIYSMMFPGKSVEPIITLEDEFIVYTPKQKPPPPPPKPVLQVVEPEPVETTDNETTETEPEPEMISEFFPVQCTGNPSFPKEAISVFLKKHGLKYTFLDKFKFRKYIENKTSNGLWKAYTGDWLVRYYANLKTQPYEALSTNYLKMKTTAVICYHNGVLGVGVFIKQ